MFKPAYLSKIFLIGFTGYMLIELLWRGHTHWSMGVTGGLCFLAIYFLVHARANKNFAITCLMSAAVITLIEFFSGCIVNITLNWAVWDYSKMFGNVKGQICILYTCLWYFLSIPVVLLASYLRKNFFQNSYENK